MIHGVLVGAWAHIVSSITELNKLLPLFDLDNRVLLQQYLDSLALVDLSSAVRAASWLIDVLVVVDKPLIAIFFHPVLDMAVKLDDTLAGNHWRIAKGTVIDSGHTKKGTSPNESLLLIKLIEKLIRYGHLAPRCLLLLFLLLLLTNSLGGLSNN